MKLPISQITILERQRVEIGDLSDLDSMSDPRVKQILPIVVDQDNILIDGFRRLTKAKALGWKEIEVHVRPDKPDAYSAQLLELYADIGRKGRTWQERALAFLKLYGMNPGLTYRQLSVIMDCAIGNVSETLNIAKELQKAKGQVTEADKELWAATSVFDAAKILVVRQVKILEVEMNRRAGVGVGVGVGQKPSVVTPERIAQVASAGGTLPKAPELLDRLLAIETPVNLNNSLRTQETQPYTGLPKFLIQPMHMRVAWYNMRHKGEWPLVVDQEDDFVYGCWFLGGGNVSDFYGAYSKVFFQRITDLFDNASKPLHLFAGSLPPSDKYIRVGLDPTGQYKYEIECDAEQLSSNLRVREYNPDIIYADPPYSVEDMEHYQNTHLVNRAKVLSECAAVLQPGGFVVWLDQVFPVFSNKELKWVGCISYIRSTANRFRCVCIFQKPLHTEDEA